MLKRVTVIQMGCDFLRNYVMQPECPKSIMASFDNACWGSFLLFCAKALTKNPNTKHSKQLSHLCHIRTFFQQKKQKTPSKKVYQKNPHSVY
jgi:hypothetical protein